MNAGCMGLRVYALGLGGHAWGVTRNLGEKHTDVFWIGGVGLYGGRNASVRLTQPHRGCQGLEMFAFRGLAMLRVRGSPWHPRDAD